FWYGLGGFVKNLKNFLKTNPLTETLREKIIELAEKIDRNNQREVRKNANSLREIVGVVDKKLPLAAGEAWSDAAISDLSRLSEEKRNAWTRLFSECEKAGGSAPSKKWRDSAGALIEKIGFDEFK